MTKKELTKKRNMLTRLNIGLERLSDPEHWVKGRMKKKLADGTYAYCAVGAVGNSQPAMRELEKTLGPGRSIISLNDANATKLTRIHSVFKKTIKRLEKELATA